MLHLLVVCSKRLGCDMIKENANRKAIKKKKQVIGRQAPVSPTDKKLKNVFSTVRQGKAKNDNTKTRTHMQAGGSS